MIRATRMPGISFSFRVPVRRFWTQDRLALTIAWPLVCLFIGMGLWLITVTKIEQDERVALAEAQKRVELVALDYASALARSLQGADRMLQLIGYAFDTGGLSVSMSSTDSSEILARAQPFHAFVVDSTGVTHSAVGLVPGREAMAQEYFRFQRGNDQDVLFISTPLPMAGADGMPVSSIVLSRRIDRPDGVFGGIVALSMASDYLSGALASADHEDGDFTAVFGRDGVLRALRVDGGDLDPTGAAAKQWLARFPALPKAVRSAVGGSTIGAIADTHLYALHALDAYPLVAVVGTNRSHALASFERLRKTRLDTATAVSLLLLILAVIGGGLVAQWIVRHHREESNRTSYRIATEGGKDGFFMFRPIFDEYNHIVDLQLVDSNVRGAAMLGHTRESLSGIYWSTLWKNPAQLRQVLAMYERASETEFLEEDKEVGPDSPFLKQIQWIRRRIVRTGDLYAVAMSDVTDERRLREELVTLANHDLLTDLYNRNWLLNNLPEIITAAHNAGRQLGIFFIDFDRFKQINDLLGHTAGDELLKAAASRMVSLVRTSDHVVHLGGDEFLIVVDPIDGEEIVRSLADYLVTSFKTPFTLSCGTAQIGMSLGIALYPRDGDNADALMRNADLAMHNAKAHGRGQYRFYDAWLYEIVRAKLETEQAMIQGLAREEFVLHYQPRVSARDGRLLGFEALVRWQMPGRGLVPPGEFIPLAEETGLIVQLGNRVVELACRQQAQWRNRFTTRVPIAVNVSARQFSHSSVREALREALGRERLPPDVLEVEITESSMLEQDLRVYQDLLAIRDMGVKILVDDFGTGYSSLSQLQRLELDVLKIDKSFVSELQRTEESEVIVHAIISMAHALKMTVVAEGVETAEQLRILQRLGCDEIQGFFVARPMPAAEAELCLLDPLRYAPVVRSAPLIAPYSGDGAM